MVIKTKYGYQVVNDKTGAHRSSPGMTMEKAMELDRLIKLFEDLKHKGENKGNTTKQ